MVGPSLWHLPLLPGDLREQPDGHRTARDWVVDGLVFLLALGISAVVLADSWSEHGPLLLAVDLTLGVVALGLVWLRRARPDAVGVLTAVASICSAGAGGPAAVALFNVALRGSRRGILATVALTLAAVVLFPLIYPPHDPLLVFYVFGVLITAVLVGWGLFARARREQVLALRDRAARLEAEQRLHVEQARDAERRRIAREMHDVLAHRISLLSLHAGALEFRPDAPPAEIAQAAAVVRASAHAALEELREVIGVLRDGEGGEGGDPERPQPTLGDVAALVEESRAAGMRVSCRIEVDRLGDPAGTVGRTAYRIVQEGLTNARKHAPSAAVEVALRDDDGLVVEVVSREPVRRREAAPPPGAGSGLVGLDERVALAGGSLEHGADAAGDFVLRARLPWAS